MQHNAIASFWRLLDGLPDDVQAAAHKQFALLRADPDHPSVRFKKVCVREGQDLWSARVTLKYRALALKRDGGFLWFWIGDHKQYDAIVG